MLVYFDNRAYQNVLNGVLNLYGLQLCLIHRVFHLLYLVTKMHSGLSASSFEGGFYDPFIYLPRFRLSDYLALVFTDEREV